MHKRAIVTAALFAAAILGLGTALDPRSTMADIEQSAYTVVELPTLGGVQAFSNFINERGWVSGSADLTRDLTEHAVLWHDGKISDLGTLGGPNSLAWHVNDGGEIVIESDTSKIDPLQENFCQFVINGVPEYSNRTCRGAVWADGVSKILPTLGGNNDTIIGANNRGQLVGTAENRAKDPNCLAPQVLEPLPAIWGPTGAVRALPLYPGDSAGAAVAINDRGQSVGGSGPCQPISFAVGAHALLWKGNNATYLGGFGGTMFNVAFGINNRAQIVGFSDLPGDTTTHAFLWQEGRMTDLGTLPGDFSSFAFSINDKGQVVGQSCDVNFNCRAFIWQYGVMTDLNTLVSPGSGLYLVEGFSINASGEISGLAFDQATGAGPAFVAIPRKGSATRAGSYPSRRVILPEYMRAQLQPYRGFAPH